MVAKSGKKFKNKESRATSSSVANQLNQFEENRELTNGVKSSDPSFNALKDELITKLEDDLKKLRIENEQQKKVEQYLRNQINYITKCDRNEKLKLEKLQQENESLQSK